jgi:hypothetical protein
MTTTPESPDGGAGAPAAPVAPPGARFDPVTGAELGAGGSERRESFALQPGEPVNSFNLVTSLMPLASGTAPQTYRWAIGLGVLVPVIAGALGFLAFAFVAAAVVVPAVYVVYMYDVNEWEDQPLGVVLGAIGLAAATGVGFTFLWHAGILGDRTAIAAGDVGGVDWVTLLVLVLLVPVGALLLAQIGSVALASRPQFDDMIDGLTFGVAAGAAFAAAETVVVNRALFSNFGSIDNVNSGFWVSLVLSAAIVKPIVYGAAVGIAVAGWSGIGQGFEGFKPGYLRAVGEALLALVAFQGGLYVASRFDGTIGTMIGLVWGAVVAVALVVRLRYMLHFAVLEAALESASTGTALKDAARGTAYCPSCDMPLVEGANFCVVCGTTTRAGNKATRVRNRSDDAPAPASVRSGPAGVAPRDNKKTALVLGAVLATILIAGAAGQAAAAAAAESDELPTEGGIEIVPNVGSGPDTEDAPEPAPAPGPSPDESVEPDEGESDGAAGAHSRNSFGSTVRTAAFVDTLAGSSVRSDGGIGDTGDGSGGIGGTTTTTDGAVDIGGGIGFTIPADWEVLESDNGYALVGTPGGTFSVQGIGGPIDVATLAPAYLQAIANGGLQDMEYTDTEMLSLPSSSIVEAARVFYRGVYADQQNGAIPIDGVVFFFITQDGTGFIADARAAQGLLSEGSPLLGAYDQMLNEFVGSL